MFLVGQRADGGAYCPKVKGRIVPVTDGFFHFVDVAGFVVTLHFQQNHFVLEVMEDNQVFVQDVQHVRCVIDGTDTVFYGNVFKITYRIEGGITV